MSTTIVVQNVRSFLLNGCVLMLQMAQPTVMHHSRIAMLNDRLANTTTKVHVGDTVKASELEFVIDSIESIGYCFAPL